MELRELRYFVALAEERHFTRAAARCFITQPAFSRAIRKLERQAGVPLLSRAANTFTLSSEGVALLAWAREVLAHAESDWRRTAPANLLSPGPRIEFELRVGVVEDGLAELTSPLLGAFTRGFPGVRLTVRPILQDFQLDALAERQVDLLLTHSPAISDERVHRLVIAEEPRILVVPANHALAETGTVALQDILDQVFNPLHPNEPASVAADWGFDKYRGEPARRARQDAPSTLPEYLAGVANGDFVAAGWLSLTRQWSDDQWGIRYLTVADADPLPFAIDTLAAYSDRPTIHAFLDFARQATPSYLHLTPGAWLPSADLAASS